MQSVEQTLVKLRRMEIELVKNILFDARVSAWDYSCGVSWKDYAEMFEAFKNRMQESAYVKNGYDASSVFCGAIIEAGDYLSEIETLTDLQRETIENMLVDDYSNFVIN